MRTSRRDIQTYSRHTLGLLACCLLAVCAYVYFLNMSVVHVVMQKESIREIQTVKNEIAVLEADYIKAQHMIAAKMATVEGLQAERDKVFVYRDGGSELVLNR